MEHSTEILSNTIQQDQVNNYLEDSETVTIKEEICSDIIPDNTTMKCLYCAKCKESFQSVKSLRAHSLLHPLENSTGRNCEYCQEKFSSFPSLIVHKKQHFSKYVCEMCWACFQEFDEFNSHNCIKNIEDMKEKKETAGRVMCQCHQCGKSYPRSYIIYHMLIHSEKRRYSCSYCPKKFKVRCSLNSHVKWVHERSRKHMCSICNATFISASSKSAHFRKLHLNERKYHCDSCSKSFFSKSSLDRHILTHTGMKNYHCHICTKSYQTRSGLNVHLKVHDHGHLPDLCH